jgi:hypothetical protein
MLAILPKSLDKNAHLSLNELLIYFSILSVLYLLPLFVTLKDQSFDEPIKKILVFSLDVVDNCLESFMGKEYRVRDYGLIGKSDLSSDEEIDESVIQLLVDYQIVNVCLFLKG